MISISEANLAALSIHKVGNKLQDTYYALSEKPFPLNDTALKDILIQYFLTPFDKVNEIFHLYQPNDHLELNAVFHFVTEVFESADTFHANSQQLAKHLFEVSNHPKIKSGELYVAYFNDVQIEGELFDAVGIFKSETKDTYFKVAPENGSFALTYEPEGVSIHKLDKGCLIFKTEKEAGYKVAVVDQNGRNNEAVYWKDDFLKLKVRNDSYNQTNNVLGIYRSFVTHKIDEEYEISKADKIDLLNRSIKYFKEKETFDLDEFSNEVIGNEEGIQSFKNYKQVYQEEHDAVVADNFDISGAAVKKQARVFKSVLKLDKNFHIYIHGNKELIEKGFDEEKRMNFYKVYFKEEG